MNNLGKQMMSESKFYMGYSRWKDEGGYETWEESVARVLDMHRKKYNQVDSEYLDVLMLKAQQAYEDKQVLGAQRALQFGGDQLFRHNARMYNCTVSYTDRPRFFSEAMYLLLCGCGVGFSVQKHHIKSFPKLRSVMKRKLRYFRFLTLLKAGQIPLVYF